jgi:hypothetical protein
MWLVFFCICKHDVHFRQICPLLDLVFNGEDDCNDEFYCTPTKKRNAENGGSITSSEKKRAKFSEEVTIINNNNENENDFNTNIKMTIHYESPCASYQ